MGVSTTINEEDEVTIADVPGVGDGVIVGDGVVMGNGVAMVIGMGVVTIMLEEVMERTVSTTLDVEGMTVVSTGTGRVSDPISMKSIRSSLLLTVPNVGLGEILWALHTLRTAISTSSWRRRGKGRERGRWVEEEEAPSAMVSRGSLDGPAKECWKGSRR